MKKIGSCLLAFLLCFALTGTVLAGGTELTVNAPDTLPEAGETFTVTVDISGNPGLASATLWLQYDKSVVKCQKVRLGEVLSGMLSAVNPNADEGAIIAAAAVDETSEDGALGEYTFEVLKSGDPDFTLTNALLTDADGEKIVTNVAEPRPETPPQQSEKTDPPKQDEKVDPPQQDEKVDPPKQGEKVDPPKQGETPDDPVEATGGKTDSPIAKENETVVLFSEFTDVPEKYWGAEYIQKAVAKGLFTGYPDGTFHPEDTISRADFVTVLWRSAGSPEPKGAAPFADVPADAYFAKAVIWAKENGYVDGVSAESFDPDGVLQRQAAMKILYYYNGGVSGMELLLASQYDRAFTDSDQIEPWAKAPMYWAYFNAVISGTDEHSLSPQESTTRAQMAKILVNYSESK